MDGGKANFAGSRRVDFGQRNFLPLDQTKRGPAEIQFDDGFAGIQRSLIQITDFRPTVRIKFTIGRVFGFSFRGMSGCITLCTGLVTEDGMTLTIQPQNTGESRTARRCDLFDTAGGMGAGPMAALVWECLRPMASESFTAITANNQSYRRASVTVLFNFEQRRNLGPRRSVGPAIGFISCAKVNRAEVKKEHAGKNPI